MKLICTQKNLKKGLSIVGRVASKNTHLPILENVLIESKEGVLKLTSTNLDIGVSCIVAAKIEKEGSFTVPASLLNSYIGLQSGDKVEIEVEDSILHVMCGDSSTHMKGIDAHDFPHMPQINGGISFSIQSNTLRNILQKVVFSIKSDDNRPEISGLFLKIENNKLSLVGTDSYRLSEYNYNLEEQNNTQTEIIIPLKTIQEVQRILPEENTIVFITIADNQILFKTGDIELLSRLIEGKYPDYQPIIPTESNIVCVVDSEKFASLIKTASLFSKPGINDIRISLLGAQNELIITSTNNTVGENISKMQAKIKGGDVDIVFNYRYILDVLPHLESDEVVLFLSNNTTAVIIRGKEDEKNFLYLVMPIRQ